MKALEALGLSEGEAKVYECMLYSDNATLQYVHEQTGIERRNVYDIINKLISKGLATYVNEMRHKVYRATNPNRIMDYLQKQGEEIEGKKQAVRLELPKLVEIYKKSKPSLDARVYRGKEGLRAMFNEMLECKDHYFIGGNWGVRKYLGENWHDAWERKRVDGKIWWHDIVTAKFLASEPKGKHAYYERKVLPPEFEGPNVVFIFGNTVANVYWGEPLVAVAIENGAIAKNYLNYFHYLWKKL